MADLLWLDRYDRSIPDPPLCPLCARVGYPVTGCLVLPQALVLRPRVRRDVQS